MQEYLDTFVEWVTDPLLILVFNIVFFTLLANYVSAVVLKRVEKKAEQTESVWDDALIHALRRPLTWLIWVLGISFAAEVISAQTDTGLAGIIAPARYVLVVGLMALFLVKFISECEAAFINRGSDVTTAEAIGKLLRISVIITAILSVLQTLGVSISGILAFGGIGGIAIGFAAKDLLANFFGGLIIYLDRPFAVGDWVRSP
ncbi:MAG: mechanosensitive ion channel domain-containing protein, partial [Pseudomonadales bacterium]